jgi:hypothetical protein
MITLTPRDNVPPLRLADLNPVLPHELKGGFDSLRAAGYEHYSIEIAGCVGN